MGWVRRWWAHSDCQGLSLALPAAIANDGTDESRSARLDALASEALVSTPERMAVDVPVCDRREANDRDEIMALRRTRIVRLVAAAAVLDALGAATAWRGRLVGEPFGIRTPVSLPFAVELVVWGSATSAPPVLDVAAIYLSRRVLRSRRAGVGVVALGALRGLGVLGEPASWGRRRSRAAVVLAIGHLGVAGAMMAAGREAGAASCGSSP
jgi:hypothetical protein